MSSATLHQGRMTSQARAISRARRALFPEGSGPEAAPRPPDVANLEQLSVSYAPLVLSVVVVQYCS